MSLPEVLLWQKLRRSPGGLRFRRQHPAGPYILDFFCATASLAIEIDGASHDHAAQHNFDQRRDAWLVGQGVRTLRIPARDVLANAGAVVERIVSACGPARPPLHHAVKNGAVPLPEVGEDFRTEDTRWTI